MTWQELLDEYEHRIDSTEEALRTGDLRTVGQPQPKLVEPSSEPTDTEHRRYLSLRHRADQAAAALEEGMQRIQEELERLEQREQAARAYQGRPAEPA